MNSVMPSACTTQQPRAFDRATLELARRRLSRADPKIRTIIRGVGPCTLRTRPLGNHLTALVRSIVFQQLSGKAASTIFHRLLSLVPKRASASDYLRLSDESLRQAGLSRPKIVYLRDLCTKIDNRSGSAPERISRWNRISFRFADSDDGPRTCFCYFNFEDRTCGLSMIWAFAKPCGCSMAWTPYLPPKPSPIEPNRGVHSAVLLRGICGDRSKRKYPRISGDPSAGWWSAEKKQRL